MSPSQAGDKPDSLSGWRQFISGFGEGAMATQTARDEKVEEILKPHYAKLQDRSGRLPAMRACHADPERLALVEGMRSQASLWATEALRAVLQECAEIIPHELASHSDVLNRIIIRLARDVANFYSISSEDTAKALDEDAKFPDLRSEIREQLRGFLAKLTEGDWGADQRRHLLPPLSPNVVRVDEPQAKENEPKASADAPPVRADVPQGVIVPFPVGEAEFKIEDHEALREAVRQTGWSA
jgi:hypothetical protein